MTTTKKLLVLLALAAGACRADNRSSISILGRAAQSSETTCDYAAGGKWRLGVGLLDVQSAYSGYLQYQLPLYVNSNLADPTEVNDSNVADSMAWRFEGVRVRINPDSYVKDLGPNPDLLPYQAENTITGDGLTIQPGSKTVLLVDVLSQLRGREIQPLVPVGTRQRMVLLISLRGSTAEGFLDTAEWPYTIEVCNGCLTCDGCTGSTPICGAGFTPASGCGGPGQDIGTVCVPTATTP